MKKLNLNYEKIRGCESIELDGEEHCDLIDTTEVKQILCGKVSYRDILNLVREKRLPAVKIGRKYLFNRAVVLNWIARSTT